MPDHTELSHLAPESQFESRRNTDVDAEAAMLDAMCASPPDFLRMVVLVQSSRSTIVMVRDPTFMRTPLHIAAMYDKVAYAAMLISRGADLEARDKWKWTPLMSAVFGVANGSDGATVALLLSFGASVDARCAKGTCCVHVCAAYGSADLMSLLFQHGADRLARDSLQETPLHKAAVRGSLEMVRYLIEHGADPHAQSASGETPADLAAKEESEEHHQVVQFLLQYRFSP